MAMMKLGSFVVALSAATCCWAQDSNPSAPLTTEAVVEAEQSQLAQAEAEGCCLVADGTVVTLEILEPVNSSLVKRGDKFRIRLAEPVVVNSHVVLAAGLEGLGEVVHAEQARGGGKPGELLLAARHLDHQGVQIKLRGMKLGGAGRNNTNAALALSLAAGPFAHFLHGREILIPAGTLAQAKIARSPTDRPTPSASNASPGPPTDEVRDGPRATAAEEVKSEPEHGSGPPGPRQDEPAAVDHPQSIPAAPTTEPEE